VQAMSDSLKVDKVLFWVKFQMIMASNYKLYTTQGKMEFVKRGVIPIRIDGYDQFYFSFPSWLLNKGFLRVLF
jgi:hypothetical protein